MFNSLYILWKYDNLTKLQKVIYISTKLSIKLNKIQKLHYCNQNLMAKY